MDSRLIFESSKTFLDKVEWTMGNHPDSEWHNLEINSTNHLHLIIEEFFITETLHVTVGRNDSFTVNKNEIYNKIKDYYCKADFLIWNENFKKVIQFNRIGVYRTGYARN